MGRYPYALVHVQSFSDEPWVMPKKKSRGSMPGPPPLMTYPSHNRATKYLCVRLTRPACSRWHVSACFDRATTGVPRDGPNHSGAAEPTSSGHLTGGFAWRRSAEPPSSDQWSAPTLKLLQSGSPAQSHGFSSTKGSAFGGQVADGLAHFASRQKPSSSRRKRSPRNGSLVPASSLPRTASRIASSALK